jgi:hypothetical protein
MADLAFYAPAFSGNLDGNRADNSGERTIGQGAQ